jgi:hypothetical protein
MKSTSAGLGVVAGCGLSGLVQEIDDALAGLGGKRYGGFLVEMVLAGFPEENQLTSVPSAEPTEQEMQRHSAACSGREPMILGFGKATGGFRAGREDRGHGVMGELAVVSTEPFDFQATSQRQAGAVQHHEQVVEAYAQQRADFPGLATIQFAKEKGLPDLLWEAMGALVEYFEEFALLQGSVGVGPGTGTGGSGPMRAAGAGRELGSFEVG